MAQVPPTDSRNTYTPNTDTHFTMPEYRTLAEWEARKKQLREQILFTAGLDPMPDRPRPRAEVFGRITNNDYTIEKVLLETRPGYYLGGNLYKPVGKTGRLPAIVSPHGHWSYGRIEHSLHGSIPARCINLARQGYIVFAYDMVGYNDTLQTPHSFAGKTEQLWNFHPLGLQLWNSIRVVDWFLTMDDVDPERIGATGASGGGTQTFLLTAVDDRVKFAAPVNMISAIMQGGSPCENAPGLRVGVFNVEIGAMMAPRPLLMVSATGDWTRNTMKEEYPAIKKIYELYDRGAQVEAVQIDAPHNYNKDSREAVYKFFAKHMLKASDMTAYTEKSIRVEQPQNMLALHGRSLPGGSLTYDGLFAQWRSSSDAQMKTASAAEKRRLLKLALGVEWADDVIHQNGALARPKVKDRVPARWTPGKGSPILAVNAGNETGGGRPILAIDAFQTGSAKAPRNRGHRHFLTFNHSDDQARVQDILTALRWLGTQATGTPELVCGGQASVWCRFAAAVAPVKVNLRDSGFAFAGTDREFEEHFFVPGIQRAGGWQAALALTSH